MAAIPAAAIETSPGPPVGALARTLTDRQIAEFSGVFRGRELTRKDRRLSSGIAPLDAILDGGIARGRVSEIVGRPGLGRTSIAAAFAAVVTRRGETAAWIDSADVFDPHSLAAAGADLSRILWVGADRDARPSEPGRDESGQWRRPAGKSPNLAIKAAEMILGAGGFGLVVIDMGDRGRTMLSGQALRLARAAERGGGAVIVMAERRTCGTFAALSLVLSRARPSFSRMVPGAPVLFDGIRVEAYVARNKLGGSGRAAAWRALMDPLPHPAIAIPAPATAIVASQPKTRAIPSCRRVLRRP